MGQFTVDGKSYTCNPLDCFEQFAITVKLTPVMAKLRPVMESYQRHRAAVEAAEEAIKQGAAEVEIPELSMELVGQLGEALNNLKDDERNAILRMCLQSCFVMNTGAPGALPLWSKNQPNPPAGMGMVTMLKIVWSVISDNLQSFGIVPGFRLNQAPGTK